MENGDGYLRAKKRVENLRHSTFGECHAVCVKPIHGSGLVVPLSPWRVGDWCPDTRNYNS
ncbi:hypothetical protein SRABI133_01979 [Peribacillus simplex]|uniref:Uncharacterized protein n=1 Tax=Peribacillus simplex TaxID=1478 RepID=A0A9W4KVF9_9BACI|nr:hypothetical protein SRABI133_01979 [Peribacillus simplex]